MKTLWIASDHAGWELKEKILNFLSSNSQTTTLFKELIFYDLGPKAPTPSVDYPDFADKVALKVHQGEGLGLLICGSGQGMSIRANRYSQVRAALVWNEEVTLLARQHNDANVLCLGSRVLDHTLALKLVSLFLNTDFDQDRHQNRVTKLG
jgi:ribose 5-phosphate isomerase B